MKIVAEITMSLDGFVTGPDPDLTHGLGRGAESMHDWLASDHPADAEALAASMTGTGAVVMGRRLFDFVDGPEGWPDELGRPIEETGAPPIFVVTHEAPAATRLGPRFRFVTGGLDAALDQACAATGDEDVNVMGGGDVVRQCVASGRADELRIHLAPILLGAGTPLFPDVPRRRLTQVAAVPSPHVTHLTYAVGGND
jgi:dihydrofolate reductase